MSIFLSGLISSSSSEGICNIWYVIDLHHSFTKFWRLVRKQKFFQAIIRDV